LIKIKSSGITAMKATTSPDAMVCSANAALEPHKR
jgi:hypothetical protein